MPRCCETQCRKHVKGCRVRSRIADGDAGNDVVGVGLGIIDDDVPISILVEDPCVEQFEFRLVVAPPTVLVDELRVRELGLWIEVTPTHPGVRGRGVFVEPIFLGVLPVVALWAG